VKEYTVQVYSDGTKYWFNKDGMLHCEHGPAIEGVDGDKWYCLHGKWLTKEEWENRLKNPCSGKVVGIDGTPYKLVRV